MNRNKRLNITIACALVASVATLAAAQSPEARQTRRPKLVVGIVIDGLDYDRVVNLRDFFSHNGFNRLIDNGVTISDLNYGSPLDAAASAAVIYTGATPAVNGVDGAEHYDPATRRVVATLRDPASQGTFTDATLSPAGLRVSNLTDELRIEGGGIGYAHSIAPDAAVAIVMAGHAGNSAVWIDGTSGRWATSTFYPEMPTTVRTINHMSPLTNRLDSLTWAPSIPDGAYSLLPQQKRAYTFRHSFPASDPRRVDAYKASPAVNRDITAVAADYISSMGLGSRDAIDMLNIGYTLELYTYGKNADNSAETIDSYLRLDRDLATLFEAIDAAGPGMNNTVVFVAGTPAAAVSRRDEERWRIPSGDFSPTRAMSLLKVNLMSIFGNGDWVEGMHDGQIYLNRDLISSRGHSLADFRRETASFMRRMAGVSYAATIDEVITDSQPVPGTFPSPADIVIAHAGDVFVAINPGWSIIDAQGRDDIVVRAAAPTSAAFIMAPGLTPTLIDTPVDARVIAPTVGRLLRIRSPNAASATPLRPATASSRR